jgi:ankyrin repeat protein
MTLSRLAVHAALLLPLAACSAETRLVSAVTRGDKAAVAAALARGASPNTRNKTGTPVIIGAITNGHPDLVPLLLQHGVDVNAVDRAGSTALMAAAFLRRRDLVQQLLDAGADVRVLAQGNANAIGMAALGGDAEIVRLFLQRAPGMTAARDGAIVSASLMGNGDVLRLLIAEGADVNRGRGPRGETPLEVAVIGGHAESVRLLVDAGATAGASELDHLRRIGQGDTEILRILNRLTPLPDSPPTR